MTAEALFVESYEAGMSELRTDRLTNLTWAFVNAGLYSTLAPALNTATKIANEAYRSNSDVNDATAAMGSMAMEFITGQAA